jgi:cell division topological specificity factor
MLGYLQRLFGRDDSRKLAKERLRLVLVHDRTAISPQILEALKSDLIQVISKYMEFENESIDVKFDSDDNLYALVANIPIRQLKRGKR